MPDPVDPNPATEDSPDAPPAQASASPVVQRLEQSRQELLELSTRNRLLSTPRRRSRSRALEVVGESADALFEALVIKRQTLSFAPAPEEAEEASPEASGEAEVHPTAEAAAGDQGGDDALAREVLPGLEVEVEPDSPGQLFHKGGGGEADPDEGDKAESGSELEEVERDAEASAAGDVEEPEPGAASPRPADQKLQTLLEEDELQKRLLRTFYDARSSRQEQGVNTLYLALGFLRWYEDAGSDKPRDAPLLLVPVTLERQNARTRFTLRVDDEELDTNLSLQAKLRGEFGVELPELPEVDESFLPSAYFAAVRHAVKHVARWEVLEDDAVLSFFSFSKFLMYRDLDVSLLHGGGDGGEEGGADHPLLTRLLGDAGFADPGAVVEPGRHLDEVIGPREMIHVVPADTSQTIAVEAVRQGRNLVVQGPPGTGKSQTIANLIAAAVHAGKTVLFVAEKMAALEVVHRRLANVGLGEMCLELHSHKATKRLVLADLERTLALGEPRVDASPAYFERLTASRDRLNAHARELHEPIGDSGLSPYDAVGRLVELHAAGVTPAAFQLEDAAGWSAARAAAAREALRHLLEHQAKLGAGRADAGEGEAAPADTSAWRGAQVPAMLPMDRQRLVDQLPAAAASLQGAQEKVAALAAALGDEQRATPRAGRTLAHRARRLAEAPPMDAAAMAHDVWNQQLHSVRETVQQGLALAAVRKQLAGRVVDAAYTANLQQTRLELSTHGTSWFRWFSGAYRRAKRHLTGLVTGPLPHDTAERLALIDQVMEAQQALRALERDDAIGRYAFGSFWRGEASDWDALGKIHGWNRRNDEHGDGKRMRRLIGEVDDPAALRGLAEAAESAVASAERAFVAASGPVQLELSEAFDVDTVEALPLGEAARRLERWAAEPDGLSRWIHYRDARAAAVAAGLSPLVDRLQDGQLPSADAEATLEFAYHEALLRDAFNQRPELARFTGESHENTLQRFRQLDADRLALARQEVAAAHFAGLPRGGGSVGQVGVLRREFQKKRRHLPLRVLLREAGLAIQAIKPVFMMSPMSVAQYLEPGGLNFDLLLIDEASQVRPVDALGAVTRCRQLVVVGDDKQLPPTRFFDSIMAHDEDEAMETDLHTADLESILGLCTAQSMPSTMLNWHYRSLHPSLIAVSNREFYDGQLNVIPSPRRDPEDLGLRFHHVTDGHFDRGGTATHRVEAQTIARAVMAFARTSPRYSLGVGAFSVRQRDAILDELEALRRQHPETEAFFAEAGEEPFFVKNLENIQGDERDVIFISVGYGPDAGGRMTMNFGPLSSDGGERRLNVLITRAKRRLEVFSSITADDIDLSRVSGRGPAAFRTFLRYAQSGHFDRAAEQEVPATTFERQVAAALREAGYETAPHVGERGFNVDLAVIDPDQPGRYLLGIVTDGPAYGRCRSARERDASREFILKMRGWELHRLWQLDWFNRPRQQLQQLVTRLESIRAGDTATTAAPPPPLPPPGVERAAAVPTADDAGHDDPPDRFAGIPTARYIEASFKKIPRKNLDGLDVFERIELVRRVIEIEAPVHRDEVIRRAADIYHVERLTDKLESLLAAALEDAVHAKKVTEAGGFFRLAEAAAVGAVRNRADVASPGLRKPERLPPAEVRLALTQVVKAAIGVSREDAVIEASRLLGFSSTRRPLRELLERELARLIESGAVEAREEGVFGV